MSTLNDIRPGTAIKITYQNAIDNNISFNVDYIGCVCGDFLLFDLSTNKKTLHEIKMLRPGLILNSKVIVGDGTLTMLKFKTELMMVITVKIPMLMVSYPKEVEKRTLRSEPRLRIELMATFTILSTDAEHLALVTDISKSGIQCEYLPTEKELEESDQNSVAELIDQEVKIEFPDEEGHGKSTIIRGAIKNIRGKEKLAVGIQFNQNDLTIIRNFYASLLMAEHGL